MSIGRRLIQMLAGALASRRSRRPHLDGEVISPPVQSQVNDWRAEIDRRRAAEGRTEEYDDVELVGRGARFDEREWNQVLTKRRMVQSSNVYAYHFIPESKHSGVLYVTFLYYEQGMKQDQRNGPGATYAYFDFPIRKYLQFEAASTHSAGKAVWDYCRVRGSRYEHQHTYYLVQAEGDYVPRKATKKGYAERILLSTGRSPRLQRSEPMQRRSTLQAVKFASNGTPNRGAPNRGKPNRGQ